MDSTRLFGDHVFFKMVENKGVEKPRERRSTNGEKCDIADIICKDTDRDTEEELIGKIKVKNYIE